RRRERIVEFDWRDKSISAARNGLDPARALGAVPEHLPKFVNGSIQAPIEIDERVGGPEPPFKALPGYYLTGPFEQKQQHLKGLLLESEFDALPAQLTTMHLKDTETNWPGKLLTLVHGASAIRNGTASRRSEAVNNTKYKDYAETKRV